MTTQQKIDAFLDRYFTGQDSITQQFRRLIENPSRHLLPPMPTKDGEYTDDRMLRIAGSSRLVVKVFPVGEFHMCCWQV